MVAFVQYLFHGPNRFINQKIAIDLTISIVIKYIYRHKNQLNDGFRENPKNYG